MSDPEAALDGLRVIDITGPDGNYCGKLLAELGADVVLIEPPTGTPVRHRGPWLHGRAGAERSLSFAYLNSSKRSVVLDPSTAAGRLRLVEFIEGANVLVVSAESPFDLTDLGLGPEELRRLNPNLVITQISPFGASGPYAHAPASDLTSQAEGGLMSMVGYPDQPLAVPYEQAYLAACQFAAVGCLIAVLANEAGAPGQVVDISAQESVLFALENAVQAYDLEGAVRSRPGTAERLAGTGVYRCKDGEVLVMAGGVGGSRFWPNLLEMMNEERPGSATRLAGPEWTDRKFLLTDSAKHRFRVEFEAFAEHFSRAEIDEFGRAYRVPVGPINSIATAVESRQLAERDFFVRLDIDGTEVRMPGAPYVLSETPWRTTHNAPVLGEHSDGPRWTADAVSHTGVASLGQAQ